MCALQKTQILLVRPASQAYWPSIYLDAFGEEVSVSVVLCISFMPLNMYIFSTGYFLIFTFSCGTNKSSKHVRRFL